MKSLVKKVLVVLALAIATTVSSFGQNGFAYQAVIRNDKGELVVDKPIVVKFTLLHEGKSYYAETQNVSTNKYGNIQAVVGKGEKVEGAFDSVPWNTLNINMKVEVAIDGNNFIEVGTTKIQTAPYAMHAQNAGSYAVKNSASKDGEALFSVNDANGNPVFAVFNEGIVVYVDDADKAAKRSGFVVTGRSATKDQPAAEYFTVTTEGTHIYVDDADDKAAKRSGFLVTGRSATKDGEQADYLSVGGEGTTVYVDDSDEKAAKRSGFLVTGRSATKDGAEPQYFSATADGTTVYVDDADKAAKRSGFLVTGRSATKDGEQADYLAVGGEGTQVFIDGVDDEKAAKRSGFLVTGRSASKDDETLFAIEGGYTRVYVDDDDDKAAKRSGFVVTGRSATKDSDEPVNYVAIYDGNVDMITNELNVTEQMTAIQDTNGGSIQLPDVKKNFLSIKRGVVKVGAGTELVVAGDLEKKVDADTIDIDDTDVEFPVLAKIIDRADTVDCSIYQPFIYGDESDEDGYALLGIYSKGSYVVVDNTDALNNHVLLLDASGFVTKKARNATVVVLMPEGDNQIYIRPLKETNQKITFGLMKKYATAPYQYIKVEVEVEASEGVPYTVKCRRNDGGDVELTGSGVYGGKATFEAIPNDGYIFAGWSDGSTQRRHTVTIIDDLTLYATFDVMRYPLVITVNDSNYGYVVGEDDYQYGQTAYIEAIPHDGYYFNNWSGIELDEEMRTNPSIALVVTEKLELIANFGKRDFTPFNGKAVTLPGVIEAENFDYGDDAFKDNNNGTSWNVSPEDQPYTYNIPYREETYVGIDSIFTGEYALSFTDPFYEEKEWYKYTVNVESEQFMRWAIRYSNLNDNVRISINTDSNFDVTGEAKIDTTPGWWIYSMISGVTKEVLHAGEYQIRLDFNESSCNVDKIMFGNTDDRLLSINIKPTEETTPHGWMPMGTVTGYGFYPQDTTVTIKAKADRGYEFAGWRDDSWKIVSLEPTLTVTIGTDDIHYDALFAKSVAEVDDDFKPFRGNPTNLPGTLEAENYDEGEDDYYDISDGSSYGDYRDGAGGIDMIGILKDSDFEEYALTWTTDGEWARYTVTVDEAQQMRWAANVSTYNYENSKIAIFKDDTDAEITGYIEAPTTGSWYRYEYVSGTTKGVVPEGTYRMRLEIIDNDCNVDKVMFGKMTDALVTATVQPYEFDVMPSHAAIGFVSGSGFYEKASRVTLKAKAAEGYLFVGWQNSVGSVISTEATINVEIESAGESGDIRLNALFAEMSDEFTDINGIRYEITDNNAKTCQVIGLADNAEIEDELTIPSSVNYGNTTFNVTSIADYAFAEAGLTMVSISDGIKSIGESAFYNCPDLTSLQLPSSLTFIGSDAFEGCSNLGCYTDGVTKYLGNENNHNVVLIGVTGSPDEVEILEGCKFIYDKAFEGSSIRKITVPGSVVSIGSHAFQECANLTEATISEGVTYIYDYAFEGCSRLRNVTIPNSIDSIGYNIFNWCEKLRYNKSGNACYLGNSENPYLFLVKANSSDITECEINDGCRFILDYAFNDCQNLTSVTVPESVEYVGYNAFHMCSRLTEIELSDAIKFIGGDAFTGVTNLKYTGDCGEEYETWGAKVRNGVYDGGFVYSPEDTGKENLLRYIGSDTEVTIPSSVTTIGERSFYGCSGITKVTIPDNVEFIEGSAFEGCTGIKSIDIPSSVDEIGWEAFGGIVNVNYEGDADLYNEGLTWGAITRNAFGDGDFFYEDDAHTKLLRYVGKDTVVTIPGTVTAISAHAFSDCNQMARVNIPSSVESIGDEAFWGCNQMISIVIPSSVQTMGYNVFESCNYGINIFCEAPAEPADWNEEWHMDRDNIVWGVVAADNGIVYAAAEDGSGNARVVGHVWVAARILEIPETIEFGGSTVSVTEIGPEFNNLNFLSIDVPSTVEHIADNTFNNVVNINYIGSAGADYDTWGAQYRNQYVDGDFVYTDAAHKNIVRYVGKGGNVEIPEGVTTIRNNAFQESEIVSVTIPASVANIGSKAFAYCHELKSVDFAEDSGLSYISNEAFAGCSNLMSITIPSSVTSIGYNAFDEVVNVNYNGSADDSFSTWGAVIRNGITDGGFLYADAGKTQLVKYLGESKDVEIPDGVVAIYENAFIHCNIESVVFPDGLETIEKNAFAGNNFETIEIPGSVKNIGDGAFAVCPELIAVTINEGVDTIRGDAFSNCPNLEIVNIPTTVRIFGDDVFYQCDYLTGKTYDNAIYLGTEGNPYIVLLKAVSTEITECTVNSNCKFINSRAFEDCNSLASIDIPQGVTSIGSLAFYWCENLQTVTYDGTDDDWNAIEIRHDNEPLTNIKPRIDDLFDISISGDTEAVINRYIGSSKEVVIPAYYGEYPITIIGYDAFAGQQIESVTFDEGSQLTTISEYAFRGCAFREITIPASVTDILDYAFFDNTNLESVIFTDDSQLASIGEKAFYECPNLQSLNLPYSVGYIGPNFMSFNRNRSEDVAIIGVIIDGMGPWYEDENYSSSINPSDIYSGALKLDDLYDGMWRENYNFEYEYNTDNLTAKLTKCIGSSARIIQVPVYTWYDGKDYNVTEIGNNAFDECPSMTKLLIPSSVTEMNNISWTFAYCDKLQEINVDPRNTRYSSDDGVLYEGSTIWRYPSAKSDYSFEVPDGITNVEYNAFARTRLYEITLSSTVAEVDDYAFDESNLLEAIYVEEGNDHFISENGILYNVDKTKLVRYPIAKSDITSFTLPEEVTSLYSGAFNGCKYLTSVTIPDGVQLGNHLFQSNTVIEEVILPEHLEIIPSSTFMECSSLKSITIPSGVTKIESQAFQGCGFTEIVIPSNVTEIEDDVFYLCYDLETISLPASLTTLADAFDDCTSLKTVYFGGTESQKDALLEQLGDDDVLKKVTWICGTYPAP